MFGLGPTRDWLHRRRLIHGQQWGQPNISQRLLRIRLHSAALLSAPALLLCAWYSFTAWAAHLSHETEVRLQEPFTWRLFQLHLHDKLNRDLHRLLAPEPQRKSALPTYGLVVTNDKLDQLGKRVPPDDGQPYYVDAQLVKGSRAYSVQVRYRGGKYWHYNHPQKSWKVRVKDGKVVEGFNTFNFINTPEAVPFEEQIILDVARELGLATPEYFPFRLLLNKVYNGVHFFESQPDEGMLRHLARPNGAIYSGSESPVDPVTGVSSLFKSADNFTKVTQGLHQELGERSELETLISEVNDASPVEFARYADKHLDLERFAQWDALDVVFGCNQHDFSENHKLYFDPYRDRFEPIAWNFRGCKHETEINRTENPLLLRLKQLPSYVSNRNRIVFQLLHGSASVDALRARTEQFLQRLREDQARDPYWDAFQMLPGVNPYYTSLLRPVDRLMQESSVETRLFEMKTRQRFLTGLFEKRGCSLRASAPESVRSSKKDESVTVSAVDVTVADNAGYSLKEVEPTWQTQCRARSWQLFADSSLDGVLQSDSDRTLGSGDGQRATRPIDVNLYPGAVMLKRTPQVHRGKVRVGSESRVYRFFIRAEGCALQSVKVRLENLVTQAAVDLSADAVGLAEPTHGLVSCNEKFSDEPGYESPHPWCYPRSTEEQISIGPGSVDIVGTRTYSKHQVVDIASGTTLRMANGSSLVFMGKLMARGTETAPIVIEGENWGGLAIQGPETKGSQLQYVRVRGGTKPDSTSIPWSGVVSIEDTSDIRLSHCDIDASHAGAAIQIGESKSVFVSQSHVRGGQHSVQIQYSSANLDHVAVIGSSGDAICATASQVGIRTTKIVSYENEGISANQRSDLNLEDVVIARGNRAIRVHEASQLKLERVLLSQNRQCIDFDLSSDSYSGKAHITGSELFEIGCADSNPKDARFAKALGRVAAQPSQVDLLKLRTEVLGIADWAQLPSMFDALSEGGLR